ncbi:alpha/beta-hydrolase [Delitschia confertaspora ATCC 74209]|uniref:Alpha/beta-hydrolase n=1 Tax=Delitschia confertaspora ATCC 74209 TaxID=1513339 RepID=A0A9P4JBG9_9PLEO|nr:alpha/beta-hydrolase [Delitschia confertaspora ATCC 74209]
MAPFLSYQPFKSLFALLALPVTTAYLAFLGIYYIPKSLRPHPEWSWHTAMGTSLLKSLYKLATTIRMKPRLYVTPGSFKNSLTIDPGPASIYTGVLGHETIKPAPVLSIWFPKPQGSISKDQKVILQFQGGGFVIYADPRSGCRFGTSILSKEMDAAILYAQYRLSRSEDTSFPAALQDCVTSYNYLLNQGVDPKNIIFSGDSAGGNLVIALLRYIEDTKALPPPGGALAWSPWVELTQRAVDNYSYSRRRTTDFLNIGLLRWGIDAYRPAKGMPSGDGINGAAAEPYISPSNHPFVTRTPLFIHSGTAELIHDEIKGFVEEMEGVEGNRIKYWETPNAPHDIMFIGNILGFWEEPAKAVRGARAFFGF